ncbi:MAG: hypothetical protein IK095_09900 [Oscillospiraceae bacterium]|nr:hypothetical protein [Oscillospiraceae bacterium]
MAKTRKRKKKTGAVAYALFLVVWIAVLAFLAYSGLKVAWRYAELYEAAEVGPVMDEYMSTLEQDMWDHGIADTIASMPHEYQTDEECAQVVKKILTDDIRYSRNAGRQTEGVAVYDLLCGNSKFGRVTLVQDEIVPEDENEFLQKRVREDRLYPWHVQEEEFFFEGLYTSYQITVPEEFTVLLNGHELTEENIIESGIPYDVLAPYYNDYADLPTKVTYKADNIFGSVDVQLLDGEGQATTIDTERDDSQFIKPASQETIDRLYEFAYAFSSRYLEFSAGTTDMQWLYDRLVPYIEADSELNDRLLKAMEGYAGWQHNSRFRFGDCTLNSVTPLAGGFYVVELSANASCLQPVGTVSVERDLRVLCRVVDDDVRAYSVEDY